MLDGKLLYRDVTPPWIHRLPRYVWGYDFFVSYQWSSAAAYAVALAEALRDRGYDCFLDRSEFAAGDDWKAEAGTALRSTQRLIVVGTHVGLQNCAAIAHEVRAFRETKRRVIVVAFGRAFTAHERRDMPVLALLGPDTIDVLEGSDASAGKVSEEVITELVKAHGIIRRRSLRARLIVAAFALLGLLLLTAVGFGVVANQASGDERRARQRERIQSLLANARADVNRANLLRETKGPELVESRNRALARYRSAAEARLSAQQLARTAVIHVVACRVILVAADAGACDRFRGLRRSDTARERRRCVDRRTEEERMRPPAHAGGAPLSPGPLRRR